jgi:hypothetical protein
MCAAQYFDFYQNLTFGRTEDDIAAEINYRVRRQRRQISADAGWDLAASLRDAASVFHS